jgi:hypothetical protein
MPTQTIFRGDMKIQPPLFYCVIQYGLDPGQNRWKILARHSSMAADAARDGKEEKKRWLSPVAGHPPVIDKRLHFKTKDHSHRSSICQS